MSSEYGSSSQQHEQEDDKSFTVDEAVELMGFGPFQKKVYLLCGYHWLALGMQMLLLSLIKIDSQCEFDLSENQAALIASSVGVGFLTGNFFWGIIADSYGRYPALIASTFLTLAFGIASAFSKNYMSLLVLRGLTTFGVGGNHVSFSLSMEFLPKSARGWAGMIFAGFWSFGVCVLYALAIFIMPMSNWRVLIIVGSLPAALLLLAAGAIPESPMWLASICREPEALEILKQAANENQIQLPKGKLVATKDQDADTSCESSGISSLLRPSVRSLTIKLWVAWFVCAFSYYGSVVLQPEILSQENKGLRCTYAEDDCKLHNLLGDCKNDAQCTWKGDSCGLGVIDDQIEKATSKCAGKMTTSDYISSLISSTGELSGLFLALFIVDKIGRRAILAYMFGISGIAFFMLSPCTSRTVETWLFFVIRGASGAYFQGTFIITTEIFPSEIRSTAMGVSAAIARLGLILTPFVGQVLSNISLQLAILAYGGSCVAATIASILVPIETTGRPLYTKLEELESLLEGNENNPDLFESFKNEEDAPLIWQLLRIPARFDATVERPKDLLL